MFIFMLSSLAGNIYGGLEEKKLHHCHIFESSPTMVQWIDKYYCHLHLLPPFSLPPSSLPSPLPPFYTLPSELKEKWYERVQNISSILFSCRPSHGHYGINKYIA
jgi:hypothetical protein